MNLVKNIWRAFTTPSFRVMVARLRMIANKDIKIIPHPIFADDGLISQHISDFMSNDKFLNAYREGVAQGGGFKIILAEFNFEFMFVAGLHLTLQN